MDNNDSTLDKGMDIIRYGLRAIFGVVCFPLLMALWELYAIFFLYIGVLAVVIRLFIPCTRSFFDKLFNSTWSWVKRISYNYGYYFFGEAFDKYW